MGESEAIEHRRLLAEDPELASAVPPAEREEAIQELGVRAQRIPRGRWTPPPPPDAETLGLLVLEGKLVCRIGLGGRCGVELVGEGDLLRPWRGHEAQPAGLQTAWMALSPATLAWIDGGITRRLGRYPALAARLFERALRNSRQLAAQLAIVHQPRVEDRLLLVLWQLAGRWGQLRRDGLLVPARLTHALLAELVAARRPTVTSALSQLARRGRLRQVEEGWLLLGGPPALMGVRQAGQPPPLSSERDGETLARERVSPTGARDGEAPPREPIPAQPERLATH
jgi:CRP/FNR family cyclic AMP-dependent transcriptional regulator